MNEFKLKRFQLNAPRQLLDILDRLAGERYCDRSEYLRSLILDVERAGGKFPTEIKAECTEQLENFRKRLAEVEKKLGIE
ncbi:MAG: hypothetical protein Q4D62_02735 [Planctomycetia bacterium]|nr:hypothetical protein [Planctomycetia bacterium]